MRRPALAGSPHWLRHHPGARHLQPRPIHPRQRTSEGGENDSFAGRETPLKMFKNTASTPFWFAQFVLVAQTFEMRMSDFVSPSTSASATEVAWYPAETYPTGGWNVLSPLPANTPSEPVAAQTPLVSEEHSLATAISGLPSPLKSPPPRITAAYRP